MSLEADLVLVDAEHMKAIGTLEGYYPGEDRPYSVRPYNSGAVNTHTEEQIKKRFFSDETVEDVLMEKLEKVEDYGHEECACTKAEKVIERTIAEFKNKDSLTEGDGSEQ